MTVIVTPAATSDRIVIPGLEARHSWNAQVLLNDVSVSPRYRLREITGLRSTADPEDNREPATGRRGEVTRRSWRRGKTITYEGQIEAQSLSQLRSGEADLADAFQELDAEGEMLIVPHPDLPDPPPPVLFRARSLSYEPGTERPGDRNDPRHMGFMQPFVVTLRMSDPRFYRAQQAGPFESGALTSQIGLRLPVVLPVTIPAPGTIAGTITVENEGDADTDPVLDIYGPISNPVVENETVDARLTFEGLTLSDGQLLRVDFRTRRILLEGSTDYRSRLNRPASDWWDPDTPGLLPGQNTLHLRGESANDPARVVCTFFHAARA
jgi:hypothetical protein